MKLRFLRRTHRDYDREAIDRNLDLYEGGERMRKNVKRHIVRNDVEPDAVYERRCTLAGSQYLNYCGPIGGFFSSFLFSKPVRIEGEGFWGDFNQSADVQGHALSSFLRERFDESIVKRESFWRINFPDPNAPVVSLADWESQRLGQATLEPIPTENITHWRIGPDGEYEWLLEHSLRCELEELTDEDETITETWTKWNRDGSAQRWEVRYFKNKPPGDEDQIAEVDPPANPLKEMPIVEMNPPPTLWLMGHLAGPQIEAFRKRVALSWSIDRTCYAMPVFKMVDRKKPPIMGIGYYAIIGAEDDLIWPAPPSAPYAVIGEYIATLKDEIHRVAQVMARGVDNNAAAVGRSGESKQADDRATEIVVSAYAALVKQAAMVTAAKIARHRGEKPPVVAGMENYSILDEQVIVETALTSQALQIPSVTHAQELFKRVSAAQLPNVGNAKRAKIDGEIESNVTPESLDREPVLPEEPPLKSFAMK